jgi:hypothetical protein
MHNMCYDRCCCHCQGLLLHAMLLLLLVLIGS